jgi:uncharacterized protein (TIGR03000 family)
VFRILITSLALTAFVAAASAQERPLPLAPGVFPGSPIGPGMPSAVNPSPRPSQAQLQSAPAFIPNYWWGYGGFLPYSPYGGWGGFPPPVNVVVPVAAPEPAARAVARPVESVQLANEFPATLTLQLPVAGDVWVNGKKAPGGASEDHVLTSPVLAAGKSYTFDVKARWTLDGKTYEATRLVTVGSGDRTRVIVVTGTAVK